ncbi:mucin-2-like [Bacillus rossius redtenbacheri]|uniref:mucin-2-like n=1 Tax=Bacillus rossius redtenbacheri TaxID=93214 RepID=UPI002FDDFC16
MPFKVTAAFRDTAELPVHDEVKLTMRGATTCLILLVTLVSALGAPIAPCAGEDRLLPDSRNCSVYYSCESGNITRHSCPSELHFNSVSRTCEPPSSAGCQTDSPTSTVADTPTDPTTGLPTEQTTGEFTTECLVSEDGIEICTEFTTEGATESVDRGGTTYSTNEATVDVSTDITIEISTVVSPTADDFVSNLPTLKQDYLNTVTNPDLVSEVITEAQVSETGSSGQPEITVNTETATILTSNDNIAADTPTTTGSLASSSLATALNNTPAASSLNSPTAVSPDYIGDMINDSSSVPPSQNNLYLTTQLGTESANDLPANDISKISGEPSTVSPAQTVVLSPGEIGNDLPPVSSDTASIPAASNSVAQLEGGYGLAPANDASPDGLEQSPPVSSDSSVQPAAQAPSKPGSDVISGSPDIQPVSAVSDATAQLEGGSGLVPANDASPDGLEQSPPVSSDSSVQPAAQAPSKPGSDVISGSPDIQPVSPVSDATAQLEGGIGLVPANDASPDGLEQSPPVSSDSSVQPAAQAPSKPVSDVISGSPDIQPVSAVSDATAQLEGGSGLAPANDASPDGLAQSDSSVQPAAQAPSKPGSDVISGSPDIQPVSAVSDATAQLEGGSGLAPANDASPNGLEQSPPVSSDSSAQPAAQAPSKPGSDVISGSPDIQPVSAVSDATAQLEGGSGLAPANDASPDGLAQSDSSVQPAAQAPSKPVSDVISGSPDIQPVSAVSDATAQLEGGSVLAPANDASPDGLAQSDSSVQPAAQAPSKPGSDVISGSPDIQPVSAVSDATAQLEGGSGLAPANDASPDGLAQSDSSVQPAAQAPSKPGSDVISGSTDIQPVSAVSDATAQLEGGSGFAPANDASPDDLAQSPPVSSDSSVQPAAQAPSKLGSDVISGSPDIQPVSPVSDATAQLEGGIGLAPANDTSPDGLAQSPPVSSDYSVQPAVQSQSMSRSDVISAIFNIPQVLSSSYSTARLDSGPGMVPANYASQDSVAKPPVVAPYYPAQPAVQFPVFNKDSNIPINLSGLDAIAQLAARPIVESASSVSSGGLVKIPLSSSFDQPKILPPGKPGYENRESSALQPNQAVTDSLTRAKNYLSPENIGLSAGIPEIPVGPQPIFHDNKDANSFPAPINFNWHNYRSLATESPDQDLSDTSLKSPWKNNLYNIKHDLKQRILSEIKQLRENITSAASNNSDIINKKLAYEIRKKIVKDLITNITTILNELPIKSRESELNLPQFNPKIYKRLVKEFIYNVTIAFHRNADISRFHFTTSNFSAEDYKIFIKEFINNITAIRNKFPTSHQTRRPTTTTTTEKSRAMLRKTLKNDSNSESEESGESLSSKVVNPPNGRRTIHPRVERLTHRAQKKVEKEEKKNKAEEEKEKKKKEKEEKKNEAEEEKEKKKEEKEEKKKEAEEEKQKKKEEKEGKKKEAEEEKEKKKEEKEEKKKEAEEEKQKKKEEKEEKKKEAEEEKEKKKEEKEEKKKEAEEEKQKKKEEKEEKKKMHKNDSDED